MKCKRCGKELLIKAGKEKLNPIRRFCDSTCKTRWQSQKYYYEKRDEEEQKVKQKKRMSNWYQRNKKRQDNNTLKNYKNNRGKWAERDFTKSHRKVILKYLNKKCGKCGVEIIKVIHHEKYGNKPLLKQYDESKIKKYTEDNLKGFCSTECHRFYERRIREK